MKARTKRKAARSKPKPLTTRQLVRALMTLYERFELSRQYIETQAERLRFERESLIPGGQRDVAHEVCTLRAAQRICEFSRAGVLHEQLAAEIIRDAFPPPTTRMDIGSLRAALASIREANEQKAVQS